MAYNFAKRFKTLKGLTPYQFICSAWQKYPDRFDPAHRLERCPVLPAPQLEKNGIDA
jgi:hypothetical protein